MDYFAVAVLGLVLISLIVLIIFGAAYLIALLFGALTATAEDERYR